jgi:hypothetical protein
MKEHVGDVDGTPEKRMYWSIISDYGFDTALAELIDNAIDNWSKQGRADELVVELVLNDQDQSIVISDNSGGVPELGHSNLVSPGSSSNDPNGSSIGVFGVGSKRAVVALAKNIRIQTRHGHGATFQFDIDEQWLSETSWALPKFITDSIAIGSTKIDLSRLRIPITQEIAKTIPDRLAKIYGKFLSHTKFRLLLGRRLIKPITFDSWSFPTGYEPICLRGKIEDTEGGVVDYEIKGGLMDIGAYKRGEYGVYCYCNGRLIAEAVRDPEVGFVSGLAGLPHSEASLARVVCEISGPAKLMPWNSFKTGINYHHKTFRAIRERLIEKVSYYASLSRRLAKHKEDEVFRFTTGEFRDIQLTKTGDVQAVSLPPLPRVKRDYVDRLLTSNRSLIRDKPWTLGLIESIAAVEIMTKQRNLQTKNRIALLLLDSAFEIGLKEFLVHQNKEPLREDELKQIFKSGGRPDAWIRVKKLLPENAIGSVVETKIEHFYKLRNKLVHQIATTEPALADVQSSRDAVEKVMNLLFEIDFGPWGPD